MCVELTFRSVDDRVAGRKVRQEVNEEEEEGEEEQEEEEVEGRKEAGHL